MTTIEITLPDRLADEAERAGLFAPDAIARLLRAGLRQTRVDQLMAIRAELARAERPPMTPDEIDEEIAAYRAEQRHAVRP